MVYPVSFLEAVKDQTKRTFWSLRNVMDCIPDSNWSLPYCGVPLWKHVYHTLHSLDKWYINPFDYHEPDFHAEGLSDLNTNTTAYLSRDLLETYASEVEAKLAGYLDGLTDRKLLEKPPECPYTRFHLILAQHRHADMHIGIIMGDIISDTGHWPKVLGLMDRMKMRQGPEYY